MSLEPSLRNFEKLELKRWRQFEQIDINFHPRLTVLTGANASGKTTILELLASHFQWSREYYGTPERRGKASSSGTFWRFLGRTRKRQEGEWTTVGSLKYGGGSLATIQVPPEQQNGGPAYSLQISPQMPCSGLYLTSHRSKVSYSAIGSVPTVFYGAEQVLSQFTNEVRNRHLGHGGGRSPFTSMKEALISAAVFGEGNSSVDSDPDAQAIWTGYQRVLSRLLPSSLGFDGLHVRRSEIVVRTRTEEFLMDELSGGLSALLELSWQIFLESRSVDSFTVLLDEPENHLHPSLQRSLLASLMSAFDNVQFVVATHSPFIVTAVPDSYVYVLNYSRGGRVYSEFLDYVNRAASADETLHNVLGLESTMPLWAEQRFNEIVRKYISRGPSTENMQGMREELERNGLAREYLEAVVEASDYASDEGAGPES